MDDDHLRDDGNVGSYKEILLEVRSDLDSLKYKQRDSFLDIGDEGVFCEVCKILEIEVSNETESIDSEGKFYYVAIVNLRRR